MANEDRLSARTNPIATCLDIPSRRQFGTLSAGLVAGIFAQGSLADAHPAPQPRKGLLVRHENVTQLDTRSKIVMELEGELRLRAPTPKNEDDVRTAEVKAKSTLDYFERIAFSSSQLAGAARSYVEAKSENWISGNASSLELRPDCADTKMFRTAGNWQQYCDSKPLDRREVELLHSPINSGALELMLPTDPAKPDSEWKIDTEAACTLFNLEAVHSSSLKARITKVEKGVATVLIQGELDATANSVPAQLSIDGNYQVKAGSQCAFITWVGIVIKETREISESEPGFTITARIRLLRKESPSEIITSAEQLRKLAQTDDASRWLVRLQSTAGRYSMLADRGWHTHIDSGEEAVLRLVDNNTIIAQCSIARMPKLAEGAQLTLEGWQADIKKALGENFDQFLESQERLTSGKLRLLRTVVAGMAEDVPIQWVYNHLSDDEGRRVAMIYTMGGNVTDKFGAADEQMTSSFEFLPEPKANSDSPTPAPTNGDAVEKVSSAPQQLKR